MHSDMQSSYLLICTGHTLLKASAVHKLSNYLLADADAGKSQQREAGIAST